MRERGGEPSSFSPLAPACRSESLPKSFDECNIFRGVDLKEKKKGKKKERKKGKKKVDGR